MYLLCKMYAMCAEFLKYLFRILSFVAIWCVHVWCRILMAASIHIHIHTYTMNFQFSIPFNWICVEYSNAFVFNLSFESSHFIFTILVCMYVNNTLLEQKAFAFLLLFHLQGSSSGCFENFTYALLRFGRAFQIGECVYFLGHCSALLRLDRLLLHFRQFLWAVKSRK